MRKRRTEADLLNELKTTASKKRGLTEIAERTGFTVQFISDVIYGRRGITENLAASMGYRRVVEYERLEQQ
jgi:hypothetical protein